MLTYPLSVTRAEMLQDVHRKNKSNANYYCVLAELALFVLFLCFKMFFRVMARKLSKPRLYQMTTHRKEKQVYKA